MEESWRSSVGWGEARRGRLDLDEDDFVFGDLWERGGGEDGTWYVFERGFRTVGRRRGGYGRDGREGKRWGLGTGECGTEEE